MNWTWTLLDDCDCEAFSFPVENFTDLEAAVMRAISHLKSGVTFWSIHVNGQHLLVGVVRENK